MQTLLRSMICEEGRGFQWNECFMNSVKLGKLNMFLNPEKSIYSCDTYISLDWGKTVLAKSWKACSVRGRNSMNKEKLG